MEMEQEVEQFRQEAQRLRGGRRGGALPFPEVLRAFAVRYAEHTRQGGGTVAQAAEKLGVSAPTLYEWRKGRAGGRARMKPPERGATLVPVRVAGQAAAGAVVGVAPVVLVTPGGFRVEGLSVESAAQLLGRLAC